MPLDLLLRLNTALDGQYRLEREIGAGGMATVYLAEDVKHRRQVAIKVLREDIGTSVGGARFVREIEIAAKLQHPNILPLLDSGEADGLLYYVMPFVEGQSLRQRLDHERELPIGEAVRVLAELVDALSYAHSRGVVHRDIKPDNIMLSGRHALITDFGVARALREAQGSSSVTTLGVALGTPAYMSPEQATADPNVDHRADIYAVGIVAYELLAGRTPFEGATPQQMLAAHVTIAPDLVTKYRPSVSPQLESVVMRCLEKRAADRWQTSSELLAAIEPLATPSGGMQPTGAQMTSAKLVDRPATSRTRLRAGIAVAVVIAVAAIAWVASRGGDASSYTLGKTTQLTTDPGLEIHAAISPDGRLVAYSAGTAELMRVFVRPVGGGRTIQLSDDTLAMETHPRWSPNGSEIIMQTRGGIAVVPSLGGARKSIVPASATSAVSSAAWSPDGTEIAFGRGDSLFVMSASGGTTRLVSAAAGDESLNDCDWSPNGEWLACVQGNPSYALTGSSFGNIARSVVRIHALKSGESWVVSSDSTKLNQSPRWSRDSRELFYVSNSDGARDVFVRRIGSDGHGVGDPVRLTTGANVHSISLSASGQQLAYTVFTSQANVWSQVIPSALSSASTAVQVTSGSQTIESMMASRDGQWIVYDSDIKGPSAIFRVPVNGGTPELLASELFDLFAGDLSPDGREVAYHSFRNGTRDIEVKALDGSQPVMVTSTQSQESYPVWSPDGNSIVFFDQTNSPSVFVVRRRQGKWETPIRIASGAVPRWMPDGRILFESLQVGESGAPTGVSIIIANADGRDARVVYTWAMKEARENKITPSVDGQTIYIKSVSALEGGQVWSVSASGGALRKLLRFDDPMRPSARTDLTVDATRLFYRIENRQSDIWVTELTKR